MPHSDPDKHREASREAMRRYRERQRTGQQPQQPKERAPREGAEIRKIDRLTRVHESRVPKWAKPVLDAGIDLTTEAGRLDAVRRCRAARAEHKAALKVKREAKAKADAEWEAERKIKRCTFCRKPQSEVRLLGDVNFICDGCVSLAAQEIGVEKTISHEARVQIVRDAIENDLEIILDALKQWRAEKARWVTDLDTRLRLAIKLVRPLVGIKFHEMRKRWYYDKATVRS